MRTTTCIITSLLLLTACARPMYTQDVQGVTATCSNVDTQIAMLEKERKENNRRILAGVTAILPVGAVYHIVRNDYVNNVKIATGTWAEMVDAKLEELKTFQTQCQQQPTQQPAPQPPL